MFKSKPENKRAFCKVGVWAWSRHPNYFGDCLFWSSATLLAIPALGGNLPMIGLALLSPAMTFGLLLGLSGIPLLEAQHDEKYGAEPEYQQWKARTSIFVPFPPAGGKQD
jgi:steroid 5-alpha reductase family enzyme